MLTAFVKERHDHIDAAGFSCHSGDHTFQILIVFIRGHVRKLSGNIIGKTAVAHIYKDVQIITADGVKKGSFSFTGTEAGGL